MATPSTDAETRRADANWREVERLRAELKRYGHHARDCQRPLGPECTCGWEERRRTL